MSKRQAAQRARERSGSVGNAGRIDLGENAIQSPSRGDQQLFGVSHLCHGSYLNHLAQRGANLIQQGAQLTRSFIYCVCHRYPGGCKLSLVLLHVDTPSIG